MTKLLSTIAEVDEFVYSTEEFFRENPSPILRFKNFLSNQPISEKLSKITKIKYDAWIIHNVFPAMSSCVYEIALKQNIPIIHYMHNYRMGCLNGVFYRNEERCFKCKDGNFLHGIIHSCWRQSTCMSILAALSLTKMRRMGVWKSFSAYIAVSQRQKNLLVDSGIAKDKVHVIPHFVPLECNISKRKPGKSVLFVGRLTQEKGVLSLIKAWEILNPVGRKLYLMGDGPLKNYLENYIILKKINNVHLIGFLPKEKQKSIWVECGLVVVPSLCEETFGMVVPESWAHGVPVVVTPRGGLTELISPGENGWIAKDVSVEALANALNEALKHDDQWERMGKHGYFTVKNTYSEDNWIEAVELLFKQVGVV